MKIKLVYALFFGAIFTAKGQIVNIESLRLTNDSLGFKGQENLDFAIVKNTQRLFTLNNNLGLQYRAKQDVYLFLSNLSFNFSETVNFERNGFAHLRYGRTLSPWLMLEALTQYQIDIPLRIEQRVLAGLGPRFTLLRSTRQKLITGHLILYENDRELNNAIEHQNARLSSYLVYELLQNQKFRWTTTVYYQPRLDRLADFRFSGQTQLSFTLYKKLQFITSGSLNYDAFPVQDPAIPKLTYKITNGIRFTF
jgi:hypothetical protein